MKRKLLLFKLLMLGVTAASAQTNPTAQSLPYAQDFSTLAHSGTTYPAGIQGWTISTAPGASFNTAAPAADRSLVASSSASTNSGNVHNYNGKIGFLNAAALDLSLVLAINTTGLKDIQLDYDIMTLRNPYDTGSNTRINEVTVQYRIGTTGTFTSISGAEYENNKVTQTGSGVTTPQNLVSKSILLPADCDSEAVVQIRWVSRQVSGGGSRPSFALDNINVAPAIPVSNKLKIAATSDAVEGTAPTAGVFTFTFVPATTAATTFNYTLAGAATFATDYSVALSAGASPATLTAATGTISVPSGVTTFTATVNPINDALAEGMEDIKMTIRGVSAPYSISDSTATMKLLDDESTPIHAIQGTGMTATAGAYTIEAIVTGVFPTLSPAGFYVQEEDADRDADVNTSEGIFVVSASAVSVGDKVKVSGTVLESSAAPSYNQAVISASSVSVLASGVAMPTAATIKFPLADTNDFEKYECMLVRFLDTLTVTDNYTLGRYGEVGLSQGGVLFQPSQVVDLNDATASGTTSSGKSNLAAVNALSLSNKLRSILLDDGRGTIPTLPFVNSDSTLRLGSTTDSLWGIMGYAFSKYRIQPVRISDVKFRYAARPALPSVGAANVRIASFNVLNYFNGDGAGGGFPTERGAHSGAEFTRQRDKIISAIAAINADVVGLIEIENDGTGSASAIQDLVNGVNAIMGTGTYSIVNDGATKQTYGTDAIRCGIIYKPASVTATGAAMLSPNTVFNRPPLAQTFKVNASDSVFNFVINHFKSKGCSGSTGANTDQADGQSCYNQTRKLQAGELVNFIKTTVIPTSGTAHIVSMGDYNAYFEEDPLDSIRSLGYTVLSAAKDYSYLFSGLVGSLDNAFVSASLLSSVTGVAKWNINAAEPTHLGYDDLKDDGGSDFSNPWAGSYTPSPFRSSDHDPVIVGLNLAKKTGIAAMTQHALKLYPNPATERLTLQYEQAGDLHIYNAMGQLVSDLQLVAGSHIQVIDVSKMASGLYIIKLDDTEGNSYRQQFIRQ
ncbi:MAG TPA: ExeM/NucH family extracellular endonuclease [Chitinophagaceae bacterium]|nr:ExeM/NucH family extracellular endonuclease [Chitinophagaceae bacterium]